MNNSTTIITKPSFVFGYWRPWNAGSGLIDSYLDYAKDVSLVKYGADTVGKYIREASNEQVNAINQLGIVIGAGMDVLSNQIAETNQSLDFINKNLDIINEQQKLSNLLLQNIAELLRVPDSEKERQQSIELGIKFFVNAQKNSDLYEDALEELLKAEKLMKQDYFVLHRIGCIFMYVEKFCDPKLALEYFLRAAKYASVESDPLAIRLANILTTNFNNTNSDVNSSIEVIQLLVADSYVKAAFAAYVVGDFANAVNYQKQALTFENSPQNSFLLAKYQIRNCNIKEGIENLNVAIEQAPELALAVFKEIDLVNDQEVIKLVAEKNVAINNKIVELIEIWKNVKSTNVPQAIKKLSELQSNSYEEKIKQYYKFVSDASIINQEIFKLVQEIDELIIKIQNIAFVSFKPEKITQIIEELTNAKGQHLEIMQQVYNRLSKDVENDRVKVGSNFAGGIVFYIDEKYHGLVCADQDLGEAIWGKDGNEIILSKWEGKLIGAFGTKIGAGRENTKIIVEKVKYKVAAGFWTSKPGPTAARLCTECNYNGYKDWYLPSIEELKLVVVYLNNNYQQTSTYWSSTEFDAKNAWMCSCDSSLLFPNNQIKYVSYKVRAIRAF
jgi:tetratricopeptide (TPR) repeat protein